MFYCCVDVHSFTLQIRNVLLRIICIIHLCDNDQRIFKSTHGSLFCLNNHKHTLSIITNLLLIYYSKSDFNHVVMTRTRKPAKKTSVVTEYRHGISSRTTACKHSIIAIFYTWIESRFYKTWTESMIYKPWTESMFYKSWTRSMFYKTWSD